MVSAILFLSLLSHVPAQNSALCQQALANVGKHIIASITGHQSSSQYLQTLRNNGKGPNQLGHYAQCKRDKNSEFFLAHLKIGAIQLFQGLCLPKQCTQDDVSLLYNSMLGDSSSVQVQIPEHNKFGPGAIFSIIFISFLILIVTIASVYDAFLDKSRRTTAALKALLSFSAQRNIASIFSVREKTNQADNSDCLDTIRVMSMFLIILGHGFAFKAKSSVVNIQQFPQILGRSWVMTAYTAFFAVDVFFWLGGFLMGYLTLSVFERRRGKIGAIGWILMYAHRFLRILPVYMFMMMIYVWLVPPLSEGPLWYQSRDIANGCDEYWWTNFLFLNNFLPRGLGNYCFGIGWYLANDMQFFWLAPFVILLYMKFSRVISWAFNVVMCIVGIVIIIVIAEEYDYRVNVVDPNNNGTDDHNYFYMLYYKPYCRYIPYLLGLYTGFVYLRYMKMNSPEQDTHPDHIAEKIIKVTGQTKFGPFVFFVVGIVIMVFFIMIQWPLYRTLDKEDPWTPTQQHIFLGVYKFGFVMGLIFAILPLLFGRLKPVYSFMTLSFWNPLAKVTFCAFLIHYGILVTMYAADDGQSTLSGLGYFKDWVFTLTTSYVLGFFMHISVQLPFGNLEKMLCAMIQGRKG